MRGGGTSEPTSAARAIKGLVNRRLTADGSTEYKVRWKQAEQTEDSWVAEDAIPQRFVEKFEVSRAARKKQRTDGK